jgi:hypothetical protein
MSNEKFRPFGPNNIVNHRYNIDADFDSIIPYKINGKYYPAKLSKQVGENTFELLGYTDIRGNDMYDWTLYLNPDDPVLEKYNYKHGYFEMHGAGDYRIEFQTDYGNNTIRIVNKYFLFKPYSAVKTEEEILENERERIKEMEPNEHEKGLYANKIGRYIENSTNEHTKELITQGINRFWSTLENEITVFRGQQNPLIQEIKTKPKSFFSTSLDEFIAINKFISSEHNCCLFVIHAQPGVKYYSTFDDMYEVADRLKRDRQGEEIEEPEKSTFEGEVLLEGNGQFFQDRAKTVPGFRELSFEEVDALGLTEIDKSSFGPKNHGSGVKQTTGIFEAYYFPPAVEGGRRKKRKTRKQRKQKRKSRKARRL